MGDQTVDVQVAGLRRKLGDCGRYIQTVRGVGYRFQIFPLNDNLPAVVFADQEEGTIVSAAAVGGGSAVGDVI